MDCMRDGFKYNQLLDHRYLTVSPLNHGSFGMVFTAKDTWTGKNVAIKCITKPGAPETLLDSTSGIIIDDRSEELDIHSKLPQHNHIVNLTHCFETKYHQYMVLELCTHGDLYEAIRVGRGPRETEHVRDFMLQLVDAVNHLHSNGVYHRDIKPENIFLTASGNMKLGDFGLATTETWSTEFAVGSDRYMAPEQYDASVYGYGYSPASADVWAIGIVLLNVLFQRNPFATPTIKDPLFADFAMDRQSLFDVFPNMSQDTYNVIRHSLTLDPANRSLGAVREAIKSVISFTTDDESLDDFCTQRDEAVPMATAAREPLRTPSISSPNGSTDDFPWSTVLTPQKPLRHLPTIPDDEPELFPGSLQSDWQYPDTDEASLSSNVDSGLGVSYKSTKSLKSFAPKLASNFVGSLPITFNKPSKHLSPYGVTSFSKSWSDLWDEDNEEMPIQAEELSFGVDISRVSTAKPATPLPQEIVDDRGCDTPRQAKVELARTLLSGSTTPTVKPALAKTLSSTILDKWAALGNFRRAKQESLMPSPAIQPTVKPSPVTQTVKPATTKTKYTDAFASFTSFGQSKVVRQPSPPMARHHTPSKPIAHETPARARAHSANDKSWDRAAREHSPKRPAVPAAPTQWALDNNWREHKAPAKLIATSTTIAHSTPHMTNTTSTSPDHIPGYTIKQHIASTPTVKLGNKMSADSEDLGGAEWVGGWKDFHL